MSMLIRHTYKLPGLWLKDEFTVLPQLELGIKGSGREIRQ